ncbi:hypothetical protein [Derxia gummosa]|uniref:Uncharacterized protein n=1 Tax=Derxia gummosa DSM 723 TaxID=1121388 RepID=A0A8B6X0X0_9BURK|nr:hypothetical protein [Derxia gummosa]
MSAQPSNPSDHHSLRELAARVVRTWQPACWFGFIVEAIPEEGGEEDGEPVQHPAHFLVAAWPPVDAPPLPLMPAGAAIVSRHVVHAAAELLRLVPRDVPIVMLGRDSVNTMLVADMILAGDRNLDGWYRERLETFAEAERRNWRLEIGRDYSDRDEGFERFKQRILGQAP